MMEDISLEQLAARVAELERQVQQHEDRIDELEGWTPVKSEDRSERPRSERDERLDAKLNALVDEMSAAVDIDDIIDELIDNM